MPMAQGLAHGRELWYDQTKQGHGASEKFSNLPGDAQQENANVSRIQTLRYFSYGSTGPLLFGLLGSCSALAPTGCVSDKSNSFVVLLSLSAAQMIRGHKGPS